MTSKSQDIISLEKNQTPALGKLDSMKYLTCRTWDFWICFVDFGVGFFLLLVRIINEKQVYNSQNQKKTQCVEETQ